MSIDRLASAARRFAVLSAFLLVSGCASLAPPCLPPARMMASAELYFGRNIGDRPGVSDRAFGDFVATSIVPRFPDGSTVIDGQGRWRDASRGIDVTERTRLVLITFADTAQRRADLMAIADDYKRRFQQQSVLTKVSDACVSF